MVVVLQKAKPTNKMVFKVELNMCRAFELILASRQYFIVAENPTAHISVIYILIFVCIVCVIPTAQCCVFHYKQKERNQYKSIKSIVIITRIIISLQSTGYTKYGRRAAVKRSHRCPLRADNIVDDFTAFLSFLLDGRVDEEVS